MVAISHEALPSAWVGPYEGAFTLLLKYAWLRCSTDSGVSFAVSGKPFSAPWVERSISTLLYGGVLETMDSFWAEKFLHFYAGPWTFELASDDVFRYCPDCLAFGYQSTICQVEALERCPIHGRPLLSACRSCGAATCRYTLNSQAFKAPFHCHVCGRLLVEKLRILEFPEMRQLHQIAKENQKPLYKWLSSLTKHRLWRSKQFLPNLESDASEVGETQSWYRPVDDDSHSKSKFLVAFWLANKLQPGPASQNWFCPHPNGSIQAISVAQNQTMCEVWSTKDMVDMIPTFKSIRRYLLRRSQVGSQYFARLREQSQNPVLAKQAFMVWRRAYEAMTSVADYRKYIRHSHPVGTPRRVDDASMRVRMYYAREFLNFCLSSKYIPLSIAALPYAALNDFYRINKALLAVQQSVLGSMDRAVQSVAVNQIATIAMMDVSFRELIGAGNALKSSIAFCPQRSLRDSDPAGTLYLYRDG